MGTSKSKSKKTKNETIVVARCSYCAKTFTSQRKFNFHYRKCIPIGLPLLFCCGYCQLRFSTQRLLTKHLSLCTQKPSINSIATAPSSTEHQHSNQEDFSFHQNDSNSLHYDDIDDSDHNSLNRKGASLFTKTKMSKQSHDESSDESIAHDCPYCDYKGSCKDDVFNHVDVCHPGKTEEEDYSNSSLPKEKPPIPLAVQRKFSSSYKEQKAESCESSYSSAVSDDLEDIDLSKPNLTQSQYDFYNRRILWVANQASFQDRLLEKQTQVDLLLEETINLPNEEAALDTVMAPYLDNGTAHMLLDGNTLLPHVEKSLFFQDQRLLCQVKLLEILDSNNAPLYLFDEILKWTRNCAIGNNYDFNITAPSRNSLLKTMILENNLDTLLPQVIVFKLPNAEKEVRVTTHNILHSILSLLNDKDLMKETNLIFDTNPLENPSHRVSHTFNDINDGQCYIDAYHHYCKDPLKDVLCPLILFIDKTHTDAKGNQTLEPIIFTLGIFNKETRNKENAWRTIGFVPSMDHISNKKLESSQKQADYHALMNVVLTPLAHLQSLNGLDFDFHYYNTVYKVSLKIPILFITGDSLGQDNLVGRRLQYSKIKDQVHICRYCDTPIRKIDDPLYGNRILTKASKIESYLVEKKLKKLEKIGYLNIKSNVFHKLQFCDTIYGVNGSVPADLLHTFQHGIYLYALDGLCSQKKTSVAYKKKAQDRRPNQAFTYDSDDSGIDSLVAANKSSLNIFNDKEWDAVDDCARFIGKQLSHQSDRDLPRTFFSNGITREKKKNGHEMQGVLLNWMFIFLSQERSKYITRFGGNLAGTQRLNNWLYVFERLLMVEELIKSPILDKDMIASFEVWFPIFLTLYKDVIDRQKGLKILKFHLCSHLADDIVKFGVPSSFNSSTGESSHKGFKKRAKRTQRQQSSLEEQTGVRAIESLAINLSIGRMNDECFFPVKLNRSDDPDFANIELTGKTYHLTEDGIFLSKSKRLEQCAVWADPCTQNEIFLLLKNNVLPHIRSRRIQMFTNVKTGDCIYRADPCFKTSHWQDWAHCDWGFDNGGHIPVHLLIHIDLNELEDNLTINGVSLETPGIYTVVNMIETSLDHIEYAPNGKVTKTFRAFPRSKLFHRAQKMLNTENNRPMMAIVGIDCLSKPCIAVNDSFGETDNDTFTYIFLKTRSLWTEHLGHAIRESIEKECLK